MTNGNDYLEKLNTAQRAAVEYLGGPQLVIAGAGSGKTRVLTYKIVHLLAQGCDAGRILALTFTNKAANEMRQRVCSVAGESVAAPAACRPPRIPQRLHNLRHIGFQKPREIHNQGTEAR